MFGSSYNPTKLKLNLKLAITRVGMLQKKNENSGILARKEVAKLLEKGKDELARIKVEQIIRDDYYVETLELMEMYLNLVMARFGLIETVKHCDQGILEAVTTIVWASPRLHGDIEEMKEIRTLLQARFGREFVEDALENRSNTVNPRVIQKLSVHQPDPALVEGYLQTIAEKYKVPYTPRAQNLIDTPIDVFDPARLPPPPGNNFNGGAGGFGGGGFSADLLLPEKPSAFLPAPPASAAYPPSNLYQGAMYPPQQQQAASVYPPQQAQQASVYPPQQPQQAASVYPPARTQPQQAQSFFDLPSVPTGFGGEKVDPFPNPPAPAATFDLPDVPSFPSVPQSGTAPRADIGAASTGSNAPDFDELTRRFNALKGKQ